MSDLDYYKDLISELDSGAEVSKWEADFLESLLQQVDDVGFSLSERQKGVIDRMKERYLG